jgi:hypothetical protein
MHIRRSFSSAFTLTELTVAMLAFTVAMIGLFTFLQTALRLVSRNVATNHSHDVVRNAELRMLRDLHDSASQFLLLNFDGTNYTPVASPTSTSDVEPYTQQNVSGRANAVAFRRLAGGPYQLAAATTPTSTSLSFDFGVGGALPYTPKAGDKVALPLISKEFTITAVSTTPSVGSTIGIVTIDQQLGFTISSGVGNITTG